MNHSASRQPRDRPLGTLVGRLSPAPVARPDARMRRFLLALGASRMGDFVAIAAVPFAAFAVGSGPAGAGALFTCQSLVLLAILLAGGALGDRRARRTVMIAADLLRCAVQAAVALLLLTGLAHLWMLVPLMVVSGLGTGLFEPAAAGLMPQLVEETRLARANALKGFVLSAAAVLGPLSAGVLILAGGPGPAFALDSLSFAASALLLAAIRPTEARTAPAGEPFVRSLAEGWREFRSRTWLWAVVAQFSVVNALGWAAFLVLGATVAREDLGGPAAWGAILAAAGLGEVAGCLVTLALPGRRPLFLLTALVGLWAAPLVLLAARAPLAAVLVVVLPAGAALGAFTAIWETAVQMHVPERSLSRINAIEMLGSFAMLPLGYTLAGSAQATIGVAPTLIGCAVLVLGASLIVSALPPVRAIVVGGAAPPPEGHADRPALTAANTAPEGAR